MNNHGSPSVAEFAKRHRGLLIRAAVLIPLIFILANFGLNKISEIVDIVSENDVLRNSISPGALWDHAFNKDDAHHVRNDNTQAIDHELKDVSDGTSPAPEDDGGVSCTKIGCNSILSIAISGKNRFPDGLYEFHLKTDGKTIKCKINKKAKACQEAIDCEHGEAIASEICPNREQSPPKQRSKHGFLLDIYGAPTSVELTVISSKKILKKFQARPRYQNHQPNGPGCVPICKKATVEFKLQTR